jgi:hypothetical protein
MFTTTATTVLALLVGNGPTDIPFIRGFGNFGARARARADRADRSTPNTHRRCRRAPVRPPRPPRRRAQLRSSSPPTFCS